jgi:hypothetical protein
MDVISKINSGKNPKTNFVVTESIPTHLVLQIVSDALKAHGLQILVVRDNLTNSSPYRCNIINTGKPQKQEKKKKKKKKKSEDKLLSYKERVWWFVQHYYETGMEYQILIDSLKDDDLDNFRWYDEYIKFPKLRSELSPEERSRLEHIDFKTYGTIKHIPLRNDED